MLALLRIASQPDGWRMRGPPRWRESSRPLGSSATYCARIAPSVRCAAVVVSERASQGDRMNRNATVTIRFNHMSNDEELRTLQEKPTQSVEITEFLPGDEIDPIFFDRSYYLGPDKGGDRAYRLLTEALTKSKRAAIAKEMQEYMVDKLYWNAVSGSPFYQVAQSWVKGYTFNKEFEVHYEDIWLDK